MRPLDKAGYPLNIGRLVRMKLQALRQFHGGLSGFHRVNQVIFHRFKLLVRQIPLERNHARGENAWPLPWVSRAMHCAAESARWSYWPGRYSVAKTRQPGSTESAAGHGIHIRLGENGAGSTIKISLVDPFQIIAIDDADRLKRGNPQILAQVGQHMASLHIESGPLFHKKTFYAGHWQNSLSLNHSDIRSLRIPILRFILPYREKIKKGKMCPAEE